MIAIGALAFVGFHFAPAFWMWFPLRAMLHLALTILFILSEFWISTSAPPQRRGLVLGIYATVLSLGFAAGPWLFAQLGSKLPPALSKVSAEDIDDQNYRDQARRLESEIKVQGRAMTQAGR